MNQPRSLPKTIVVVPCYNEAARLDTGKFLEFAKRFPNLRFLMVDDGSTDRTLGLLRQLHGQRPERFWVCHWQRNQGKGEAVRRGILEALDAAPAYVAYWDADLATPLEEIARFVEVLERYPQVQLVIGSRNQLQEYHVHRRTSRRLIAAAFRWTLSWSLGLSCGDTQCGAKMFRVSPSTKKLFQEPFLSRWIFDVEILIRLKRQQDVWELPLDSWCEVGNSRLRWYDFVRAVADLAAICWKYRVKTGNNRRSP